MPRGHLSGSGPANVDSAEVQRAEMGQPWLAAAADQRWGGHAVGTHQREIASRIKIDANLGSILPILRRPNPV